MEYRRAREEDLDRLIEIHMAAYPDDRNGEARKQNFINSSLGTLDDLIVATAPGSKAPSAIVAHAFLFRFKSSFGGVPVKMGGIASVAVAPEARGRGVGSALMQHLHVLSDARGDALTMLYAFRQGFYARLGYATTSPKKRLVFDTRSVPASWRELARDRVRNAHGADGAGIRNVHARTVARRAGWTTRTKVFWERFFSRERRILLVCDDGPAAGTVSKKKTATPRPPRRSAITGYVAFQMQQEHPHAETTIEVDELLYDDDETRRALLGALSAMRDQAGEIVMEVPEDDPIHRALIDADGRRHGTEAVEHSLGEIAGGPMIRVEDIPRALAARGYVGSGSFDVVVHGSSAREDDILIAASVRVKEGRAEVGPLSRHVGGALHTTRSGIAAIFYGGLSSTDAVRLDLAKVDDARVALRIDAIAQLPPLSPIDAF